MRADHTARSDNAHHTTSPALARTEIPWALLAVTADSVRKLASLTWLCQLQQTTSDVSVMHINTLPVCNLHNLMYYVVVRTRRHQLKRRRYKAGTT